MKGISPLVAAVLLIAFTVAIATIVMGWMGTFTRQTTESITNKTDIAIDCASASITIEDVYIASEVGKVVVKNSGFADNLVLKNVTIITTTGTAVGTSSTLDTDFDRGEMQTASVSISGLTCATFSKAIATTSCGGVDAEYTKAAKC